MYREFWTAGVILFILGILLAAAYVALKLYVASREEYPARAEARVVGFVMVRKKSQSSAWDFQNCPAAVFEFFADGKPVKVTEHTAGSLSSYHLHQRVRLCYDPQNPQNYRILTRSRQRLLPTLLGGASLACIVAGGVLYLLYETGFTP